MSGFTKPCIYCNAEIRLSNDSGRWLPYNLDNTAHECKKSGQTQPQPPQQKQVQEPKSELSLTLDNIDLKLKELDKRIKKTEHTLFGE